MAEREEPAPRAGPLDDSLLPIERRILETSVGGPRGFLVLRLLLAATLGLTAAQSGLAWLAAVPVAYVLVSAAIFQLRKKKKLSAMLAGWTFMADVAASLAVLHLTEGSGIDAYLALLLLILGATLLRKPALVFSVSVGAVLAYAFWMFPTAEEFLRVFPTRLALLLLVALFSVHIAEYASEVERETAKRYEERLAWMQRLSIVGKAMAAVLHEAKTPLGTIVLNAESAQDQLAKGKKPAAALKTIAQEADHATAILQNFLDFVKPTRLDLKPLALDEPLAQAARMQKIRFDEQGVALELKTLAGCVVLGSARHLLQAFTNVIANAVDAMPGGGKLSIGMRKSRGKVHVEFTDTGAGLSPAALETLYEPFSSSKSGKEGHGLGLSIVRWILAEHDGELKVTSPGRGKGTVVDLSLPLVRES